MSYYQAEKIQSFALNEKNDLAEQIGSFVYNWGFKRIHGKIWTHLLLSTEPLDAQSLCKILGISKALVSISVKELSEMEAIKAIGKDDRRTVLYIANSDIPLVIKTILTMRERRSLANLEVAHKALMTDFSSNHEHNSLSQENLAKLGDILRGASAALDIYLDPRGRLND